MKDPERLACGSAAVEGLSWRPTRFIGVNVRGSQNMDMEGGDGQTLPSVHHIKVMGQAAMLGPRKRPVGLESLSIHPN